MPTTKTATCVHVFVYMYTYICNRYTLKNNEGIKKQNSDSNESPPTSLVTGPDVLDLT